MPKLTRVVEDISTVDEKYRELYVKGEDGKYAIDVEGVEDVTALKGALGKEREKGKLADKWGKLFPDKTPEEIAALVEKASGDADKKRKGGGSDDDVDRLLKKREDEIRKELEPKLKEGEGAQAELRKLRLDKALRGAAQKGGVFEDMIDDAIALAERHFEFKDGKTIVLDEDGDPTSMTPESFFAKRFKELKPRFYKSSGASGSGAEHGSRGSSEKDLSKMNATDKIKAGLEARKS